MDIQKLVNVLYHFNHRQQQKSLKDSLFRNKHEIGQAMFSE